MKKHLEINLRGEFRGLGLQQFITGAAKKLGISGYVKRLPTGTMHVEAEGEEKSLDEFLRVIKKSEEWKTGAGDVNKSEQLFEYKGFYIRKHG